MTIAGNRHLKEYKIWLYAWKSEGFRMFTSYLFTCEEVVTFFLSFDLKCIIWGSHLVSFVKHTYNNCAANRRMHEYCSEQHVFKKMNISKSFPKENSKRMNKERSCIYTWSFVECKAQGLLIKMLYLLWWKSGETWAEEWEGQETTDVLHRSIERISD